MFLIEKTAKEYGYLPDDLKLNSKKLIWVKCNICLKENPKPRNKTSPTQNCNDCARKIHMNNINEKRKVVWTKNEIDFLKNNYGTMSYKDMIQFINKTKSQLMIKSMELQLSKEYAGNPQLSISIKHLKVNHNFFEFPNILNCYYAGLLAADGYISNNRNLIAINLKLSDKKYLEQFKKEISFSGDIKVLTRKSFGKFSDHAHLNVSSYNWKNNLKENFNISNCKSLTYSKPNISKDEHILAFIIGYLDGDGYITSDDGYVSIGFCGTIETLTWIRECFSSFLNLNLKNKIHSKKNNKIHQWSISGKKAEKMITLMNNINVPKFDRKWQNNHHIEHLYYDNTKKDPVFS